MLYFIYIFELYIFTFQRRDMKIRSSGVYMEPILKSICAGFFQNLAQKQVSFIRNVYKYKTLPNGEEVYIHPGSSLFKVLPQW